MKNLISILTILILANCSLSKKNIDLLFVQKGKTATYDGKTLTLNNVAKNTVFFSDRPERVTGEFTNSEFVKIWNDHKQKDSFKKDPPNSAISYLDNKGNLKIAIVENSDISLRKDSISYKVKILNGELEKNMRDVSLFVDSEGYYMKLPVPRLPVRSVWFSKLKLQKNRRLTTNWFYNFKVKKQASQTDNGSK